MQRRIKDRETVCTNYQPLAPPIFSRGVWAPQAIVERIRGDVKYLASDQLQGRGVGSALMAHLRAQTVRQILVGTWAAASWAIGFYERHGFRRSEEVRDFFGMPLIEYVKEVTAGG